MHKAGLLRSSLIMIAVAFFAVVWWRLAQAPFHEDEAIYAVWARAMAQGDWGVWQIPVDKPPLTFYPLAVVIAFGAQTEWVVRLPALLWGIIALSGIGRLATSLGRDGGMAQGLALASPLWWAMWASAFTDMAAVALGVWGIAVWLGEVGEPKAERGAAAELDEHQRRRERQGVAAGVLMGLAVLAKPTMIFWLPLFLSPPYPPPSPAREAGIAGFAAQRFPLSIRWRGWVEGFSGVLLFAWAWDASRTAPSWWRLGAEAYGSFGRGGAEWSAWGWVALGALGLSAGYGLWRLVSGKAEGETGSNSVAAFTAYPFRFPFSIINWMILLWIPVHGLLGFQPWERYLLPLLVMVAIRLAPSQEKKPTPGTRNKALALRLVPLALLILIAPFLVAPLQFAPQDGRWNGIRTIGAAVEALPRGTELWYGDMGRPLAWYGANTVAELKWAGAGWQAFPGCSPRRTIAARRDEPLPPGLELIAEDGDFGLWKCRGL